MVYINARLKVTDYSSWRKVFDSAESARRAAGSTGTNRLFQDINDPNTVTTLLEWDNAENARKFIESPKLQELQKKAGMIGGFLMAEILNASK